LLVNEKAHRLRLFTELSSASARYLQMRSRTSRGRVSKDDNVGGGIAVASFIGVNQGS